MESARRDIDKACFVSPDQCTAFAANDELIYYASDLLDYERLPSNEKARYRCVKCKKTYGLKKTLGRHLRLDCGRRPTFCCQICPKKFKHGYILLKHMRNTHNVQIEKMRQKKSSLSQYFLEDQIRLAKYPTRSDDLEDEECV